MPIGQTQPYRLAFDGKADAPQRCGHCNWCLFLGRLPLARRRQCAQVDNSPSHPQPQLWLQGSDRCPPIDARVGTLRREGISTPELPHGKLPSEPDGNGLGSATFSGGQAKLVQQCLGKPTIEPPSPRESGCEDGNHHQAQSCSNQQEKRADRAFWSGPVFRRTHEAIEFHSTSATEQPGR